ncbi:MAG: heparinase II/III family protein [Bosea sp. (in: a-proteobacteria)]
MAKSADKLGMTRLALVNALRRARRNLSLARHYATSKFARNASRLTLTPQDLRTADPTVAADIYGGHYVFSGHAVSTGGASPFDAIAPSLAWSEALMGLGWLRHLRAADTALSRANARSLVDDFLRRQHDRGEVARQPLIMSRRLIALASNAGMILEGADHGFYQRFVRHIGETARRLSIDMDDGLNERDRLAAAIGCAYAGLCLDKAERLQRTATKRLSQELNWQVLPDGGHCSRNPRLLVELLLDLLPLRVLYGAQGLEQPRALTAAIDRMMPHLRLFRHGDGTLALFNGMGATQPDTLATLIAYDDVRGRPMTDAPYSGYVRLEAGAAILIADIGAVPDVASAREACAGPLSFEFSSSRNRIIVNCGLPQHSAPALQLASRYTAAHSTLALNGEDCGSFIGIGGETLLTGGASEVTHERRASDDGVTLDASHDGWKAATGFMHRRVLTLGPDGRQLTGRDELLGEAAADVPGIIRFHLHPLVHATARQDGKSALLTLGDESWVFRCEGLALHIEESLFLAGPDGPRRSKQLTIAFSARRSAAIKWRLERQSNDALPQLL